MYIYKVRSLVMGRLQLNVSGVKFGTFAIVLWKMNPRMKTAVNVSTISGKTKKSAAYYYGNIIRGYAQSLRSITTSSITSLFLVTVHKKMVTSNSSNPSKCTYQSVTLVRGVYHRRGQMDIFLCDLVPRNHPLPVDRV